MDPAYYVAAGSMKARSFQLDVVSNNLANANTTAYKPEKSFFSVFNNDAIKEVTLYKGDIPASSGGRLSSLLDVRRGFASATTHDTKLD